MRRHVLVGAALVMSVLGFGCGDDDGGSDISKDDFIEQANAICEAGSADLQEASEGFDENSTQEEIADFVTDVLVPNVRDQIDEIRDLGFPEGDEDELESIFDDTEEQLDEIADDPEAFIGADAEDPFADINQRMSDYGLTTCAEG
jgi:hypothetical protein